MTALLAVVALWVLGRVRYPERPATPVPALLTQLAPRPAFEDLAAESARLRDRLGEALVPVRGSDGPVAAFRIGDNTAIALMRGSTARAAHGGRPPDGGTATAAAKAGFDVLASDPATGLSVLRLHASANVAPPAPWTPRALEEPRYLLATVASPDAVALQPAFVAALRPVNTPAWSAAVWALPPALDLPAGALVFTPDAELAGMVADHEDGLVIVPGATLLADAQRVRQLPARAPGTLGLQIQPLTPALAAATGARTGVMVAWVDPQGPAADHLAAGDVIEAADGRWVETGEHWRVRAARLAAGEPIVLGLRRHGEWRDVQLQAASLVVQAMPLGLTLRRTSGGSEVVDVQRPSAADAAGLEPGDVITLAGTVSAPSPAQVREAFGTPTQGQPLLLAISRGTTSRIVALHR